MACRAGNAGPPQTLPAPRAVGEVQMGIQLVQVVVGTHNAPPGQQRPTIRPQGMAFREVMGRQDGRFASTTAGISPTQRPAHDHFSGETTHCLFHFGMACDTIIHDHLHISSSLCPATTRWCLMLCSVLHKLAIPLVSMQFPTLVFMLHSCSLGRH